MPGAFQYKPKFVDIRVRPPREGDDDVHALKDGERACDHAGCRAAATAKAPKSREHMDDHYWFCQPHAAEYNRSWDFFAGMSESQLHAHQKAAEVGGRPTWQFKASKFSREAAAFAAHAGRPFADPFGLFRKPTKTAAPAEVTDRRLGRLERNALADLDLADTADAKAVRARYTELVKRCHPDANGGDRSAEHKLQRVVKAYQTLRKAGLA